MYLAVKRRGEVHADSDLDLAVHEYQTLQLPITVAIITQHLGDFLAFSSFILIKDAG